ncbi:MAG: sugar phosphate nucleotidyltransferase, partial [Halodesulfurarchaeum sp.]
PESTLVSIATYGFPADALSLLETYLAEDQNPDEPGWFIQWLQSRDSVYAYTFEGAWFDIGTPESYLDAVRWALDGENTIAESATLENVTLGENVHVMADAEIVDSDLDSTVVFQDAELRNCSVRDSIIDEQTHLEDIDFSGALIGAHTTIANGG